MSWLAVWVEVHLETRIPPPILCLMAATSMWVLHRWLPGPALPASLLAAAILAAAGAALLATAFLHFRVASTTINPTSPGEATQLVTFGVFRLIRNPMYLGFALILAGWAAWLGAATAWIIVPGFAVVLNRLQIIPEERILLKKFGEPYRAYLASVPRWLPLLF